MTIVGFNFTKLSTEKSSGAQGKIKVSNNVNIKEVEPADFNMGNSKQKGLKFIFHFTSKYEPNIGSVDIEGNVLYVEDEKKVKELLKTWKKDKKLNDEVMQNILGAILMKCNVEALLLSKEVNLPPPIPMPKLEIKPQS